MLQAKICKSLRFIISRVSINHNALLPHFSCNIFKNNFYKKIQLKYLKRLIFIKSLIDFHLNSNSAILTLTALKVVEVFKDSLKENFILKLVLKLCLLINDLRNNKSLRILAIRWLLNLRFSNYNFNFNKYMPIFSYYLWPFPFDNVSICLEKLKTLYLFYDSISEYESKLIIRSISIMDNYKYFPIFSNYVKSLFKSYFFIILRFPYKIFIKHLCDILRNNLKEVPRILPNMINLLRLIKSLKNMEFPNANYLKIESLHYNENSIYMNNDDLLENVDILKLSSMLRDNQGFNLNMNNINNISNNFFNNSNHNSHQFFIQNNNLNSNLTNNYFQNNKANSNASFYNISSQHGNYSNNHHNINNFNNNISNLHLNNININPYLNQIRNNSDNSILNSSNIHNITNNIFNYANNNNLGGMNNTNVNFHLDDMVFEKLKTTKNYNMKMSFDEIHKYLLVKFSKFIAKFNSPIKLYKYFDLFIEIAKENSIQPQNLIIGLRSLHNSIQDTQNWKIEKNILEVCKYLLKHHDLDVMKKNKIDDLLNDIYQKSFDYGIRDKAKLYYKLVTNVEKPILNTFLEKKHTEFKSLKIYYEYFDFENLLKNIVILEQSTEERLKAKIRDGGSAIFDKFFKQNVMLNSEFFSFSNEKTIDINKNKIKIGNINNHDISNNCNSQIVYKHPIQNISAKKINDLTNNQSIDSIIENIITPSDILRLYVNDDMINDQDDADIDPKKIFKYDQGFKFIEKNQTSNDIIIGENKINKSRSKIIAYSNETLINTKRNTTYIPELNSRNINLENNKKEKVNINKTPNKKEDNDENIFIVDKNPCIDKKTVNILKDISNCQNNKNNNSFNNEIINKERNQINFLNEHENEILESDENDFMTSSQYKQQIESLVKNKIKNKNNKIIKKEAKDKVLNSDLKEKKKNENPNYFDEKIFLNDYFTMISQNKFYIKLPLNIYMKNIDYSQFKNNQKIKDDIKTKLADIKHMYSISLCMGKMDHLTIEGPIILPYLEIYGIEENEEKIEKTKETLYKIDNEKNIKLENSIYDKSNDKENSFVKQSRDQNLHLKFPYFYKIYLMIYPTFPIPSDVENRIIFYDLKGTCYTGKLDSIKIKFQDFFLPICVPPKYNTIYESNQGKIKMRKTIFKKLWKEFKIKNDEFTEYVNTYRLIDFQKNKMVELVNERLGPFLINQNYLESDFILKSPYNIDYIDIFSDSLFAKENGKISKNIKLKDYYDIYENRCDSSSYDFMMDELFEKKSFFNKFNILKQSKYHLAQVLIFVPAKYYIL